MQIAASTEGRIELLQALQLGSRFIPALLDLQPQFGLLGLSLCLEHLKLELILSWIGLRITDWLAA